jgi:hypothetical protein
VTIWETPEAIPFRTWSPLDDRESAVFQVTNAWRTAKTIRDSVARFDALGLSIGLVAFGPFLVLALGDRAELRRSAWIATFVALYASGFLFVYFTYRYVEPVLKPLCILSCLGLAWSAARRAESRWVGRGAVAMVAVSFVLHVGVPLEPHRVQEPGGTPFDDVTVDSRPHRELAARMRAEGLAAPVASDLYWAGMYVAFFLGEPFAGSPAQDEDLETFRAGLDRVGVRTLLLDRDGRFSGALAADPVWVRRFSANAAGTTVDVYARR